MEIDHYKYKYKKEILQNWVEEFVPHLTGAEATKTIHVFQLPPQIYYI